MSVDGALVGIAAIWIALLLDRLFGEPPARWHPVVWMGQYLGWIGRRIAPQAETPLGADFGRFFAGALAWGLGAGVMLALALALQGAAGLLPAWGAALLIGIALKPLLAWRMLRREVLSVERALAESLDAGREQLSYLVSRDVMRLGESEVRESAIESLAENLNDSLVAPLFWFALAGLPGAALYRFANTADAMWGYHGVRGGRVWEWAGKFAARADDVMSWLPARITALLLALAALRWPRGLRQEARRTPSPNSGWPMAAMALLLDVRLGKPDFYVLHRDGHAALAEDTQRALRLGSRVVAIAGVLASAALLGWEFGMSAEHGGPDALGTPLHDFSTNANACGPCPRVLAAVQQADPSRYPDPAYLELRARLASFHGVNVDRVYLAASASEFIVRITAAVARLGGQGVAVPQQGYGDYARAALAQGMRLVPPSQAQLLWLCDPCSPTGQSAGPLLPPPGTPAVLDCAYAPLRLEGKAASRDAFWQLWTPNKALGLTGVRAAYAIAPASVRDAALQDMLQALMPSWPIGAHGVAMLHGWTEAQVQQWLRGCLPLLREWKCAQIALCESLGWRCLPGEASFFCAEPATTDLPELLLGLRHEHGIKLRDAAALGLPGHLRLNVMPPPSQQALRAALMHWR